MRRLTAGLFAGVLALGGTPAFAAPASASAPAVSLVVGLRSAGAGLPKNLDVLGRESLGGSALTVDVPAGQVTASVNILRADPAVTYVELDHIAHAAVVPNDPEFGTQWGLTRTGVTDAWASARGAGVTVAVVDTGVKALPDFTGRLLPGYDFVNDDNDADDDNGHGTMSAGVIAAAGDNGIGIAGICWLCKILPVKVLGSDGSGSYSAISAGIRYAADHHAGIINLSLGGASDSQLLRDAVAYAVGKGSMVIAAAGNEGSRAQHYPAAFPSVLAVGGSTAGDARYPWSNNGSSWVDLAAPGCNPAQGTSGVVSLFCGTSSATPFASGVAALLAGTEPTPSPATIQAALTSTAVPLAGNWVAAGRIDAAAALKALPPAPTGTASLPAGTDHTSPAVAFGKPGAGTSVRGRVLVTATATDNVSVRGVQLLVDGRAVATDTTAPYSFSWPSSLRGATRTLTLRAYDRAGNSTSITRRVTVDNTPPVVTVTGSARSVTATATDAHGIARLVLTVNGKITRTYAGSRHTFAVPAAKSVHPVTVQVRAYDRAGNVRFAPARKWPR